MTDSICDRAERWARAEANGRKTQEQLDSLQRLMADRKAAIAQALADLAGPLSESGGPYVVRLPETSRGVAEVVLIRFPEGRALVHIVPLIGAREVTP